uniref:Pectinesterase n=1 Tax=Oryza brachyantha TaxID=4533 RepID=J3MNM2_ORYBR
MQQPLLWSCTLRLLSPLLLQMLLLLLRPSTISFAVAPVAETITVDGSGGADFRTVQAAVDFVPDGNRKWIRIHVKEGSYREKVTIPTHKHYILLEGDGCWKTAISFAAHAHAGIDHIMRRRHRRRNVTTSPTFRSATFTVLADYFVARNIAFKVHAFHAVSAQSRT